MDLNFCPCCFNQYDKENLAYELAFPSNWNWERIKDETAVGADGEIPAYISEQDGKREKYFKKQTGIKPIILRERPTGSRIKKTSLELFIEHVRFKEEEAESAAKDLDSEYQNLDEDDESDWAEDETEREFLTLSEYADLKYFVTEDTQQVVMYVIPCCPICHMRLPKHWDTADDFCGIDLMARTAAGKTTFLCSMLSEGWRALQGFSVSGKPVDITSAQYNDTNPGDEYYQYLVQGSEEMVKNRRCPDPTPPVFDWTPPVFLQVKFEDAGGTEHTMIVGIYDNPGEHLERFNLMNNPSLVPIVDQMFADIHLFDPEQWEQTDPFACYRALRLGRTEFNSLEHMRNMHSACVIVKSDLLVDQMKDTPYSILFDRVSVRDQADENQLELKDQKIREMIEQMQLFGNYPIPNFDADYRSACWHCVSATGCACGYEELQGAYDPINIAAPIMSCLVKRMQENGWV